MKLRFYSFLILIIFGLSNSAYSQHKKLLSENIKFEGFLTETIMDISCDDFKTVFRNSMKEKFVTDDTITSKFENLTNSLKRQKSRKSLNIRGVIVFHYDRSDEEYCFDIFGYFYKDGVNYYNKKLLRFISDQIYSNHPAYLN